MAYHQYGMQSGLPISNRHSCRLELTVNPCAPTKPLLPIVTQSPLFCAQVPTTKRAPAALAPRLRVSIAEVLSETSNIEPLISNRNIPLLDTSLSSSKQRTSVFLIATQHLWGLPVSPAYRAPESTASRAREINRAWGISRLPGSGITPPSALTTKRLTSIFIGFPCTQHGVPQVRGRQERTK
jgi:hypothetical protein